MAASEGIVTAGDGVSTIHQEVGIGVLPIDLHVRQGSIERVVMTQGTPRLGPRLAQLAPLARALGVRTRDLTATGLRPQISSTGVPSLQVPIRTIDLVRTMSPDFPALGEVLARFRGNPGAYVFAFGASGDADLHARGFFPGFGIPEDPATGSAAGACGAYLARNGRLPAGDSFVIEQGLEVHHPSRIEVTVVSRGKTPKVVRVGGRVVPVMRGTLTLP